MSRIDELCFKSQKMELEDELYSYDFDPEELPVYQDNNELLAALRQKEEEVILAAQLGNALLLENRQLKEESDKLHEQYTDKLEELEQSRYDLRVRLDGSRAQWESQVAELERDVGELRGQVERLTQALSQAQRDQSRAQQGHDAQSQRLQDRLQAAMEVERTMSAELQSLKQELRQRAHPRAQEEELLSALREQVARLTQREQALEQRLETACQENVELRDSVSSLHTRLGLQEQQSHTQIQQLAEALREVEAARGRSQELEHQLEVLQEEVSLQERSHGDMSLLSELEQSLDVTGWGSEKEEVSQEVLSILDLLLPASQSAEGSRNQDSGLQSMLVQLKTVAERVAHTHKLQGLEPPTVDRGDLWENPWRIRELQDQNSQLMQENAQLRHQAQSGQDEEMVQQAMKDRDDAISKKTAVEQELVRCKNDMMCLNNQLLEAIQRKLELAQELEAWQDDIQVIINQQLRTQQQQQQQQQAQRKTTNNRLSFLPWASLSRRPSTSPSTLDRNAEQSPTPWREWLKRGK